MFIKKVDQISTNLNDGKGCPCAGHVKLSVADLSEVNAFILSLEENFGNALPTGSKNNKRVKIQPKAITASLYLNAGTG